MLDDMKDNGLADNLNIFIIVDDTSGAARRCSTGAFTTNDAPVLAGCDRHPDAIAGGDYSQAGSVRTVYEIQEGETRTRTFYLPIGSNSTYITGQYETTAHARDPPGPGSW